MSHRIAGIITSFKIQESIPKVILVGNYELIPIEIKNKYGALDKAIAPYHSYSLAAKKMIKELSFSGPCAYIETDFFVEGIQKAEVWADGKITFGPAVSFHGYMEERQVKLEQKYADFLLVKEAINTALSKIGVFCHENKDEFDSARLGDFRSNEDILREINKTN